MIKHRFRALGALLLGMALVLAACGQNPASLDPNALLREVADRYGNMNGCSMIMAAHLNMTITTEGQSGRGTVDMTMSNAYIEKPSIKAKTNIEMTMLAEGVRQSVSSTLYNMEENGKMVGYCSVSGDDELGFGAPFENGTVLGDAADYAELNAINDFTHLTEPTIIGMEKLDGQDVIHMQVKMDARKRFSEISAAAGEEVMDLSSMNMIMPLLQNMKSDLWIDAATHKPIELAAGLGDDVKSLLSMLEPLMEQEGIDFKINALELNVTVTDYDAVQDFEVPKELKNSKPKVTPGPGSDTSIPL